MTRQELIAHAAELRRKVRELEEPGRRGIESLRRLVASLPQTRDFGEVDPEFEAEIFSGEGEVPF